MDNTYTLILEELFKFGSAAALMFFAIKYLLNEKKEYKEEHKLTVQAIKDDNKELLNQKDEKIGKLEDLVEEKNKYIIEINKDMVTFLKGIMQEQDE